MPGPSPVLASDDARSGEARKSLQGEREDFFLDPCSSHAEGPKAQVAHAELTMVCRLWLDDDAPLSSEVDRVRAALERVAGVCEIGIDFRRKDSLAENPLTVI
jgi:hypothetical protein